jgi:hypothetical protein
MCWLTLLPFCVADSMGWATVPITCGMAFFLFGIEEIGVQVRQGDSARRGHMHTCMHADVHHRSGLVERVIIL